MPNKLHFLPLIVFFALVFHNTTLGQSAHKIAFHSPSKQMAVSENFSLDTIFAMDTTAGRLTNIISVFHTNKYVVVFDDPVKGLERLCFFDRLTGKFVKAIQFPSEPDHLITEVPNVRYLPTKKRFYAWLNHFQSVYEYDDEGVLLRKIALGMYSGRVEPLVDGTFLAEAIVNAGAMGDQYRYFHFDEGGQLIEKYFRYFSDGPGLNFSNFGVFTQINNEVYCAWSTDDTLYVFRNRRFEPVLIVDFGPSAMPRSKITDSDGLREGLLGDFSYFMPSFAISGHQILFSALNMGQEVTMSLVNTQTGGYLNAHAALPDAYSTFFKYNPIVYADTEKVGFLLEPLRAEHLLEHAEQTRAFADGRNEEFYQILFNASKRLNPSVIYFRFNYSTRTK